MKNKTDVEFMIDVVKQASKLITDDFIVKSKGACGDLVTNFDVEIEKFIISKIKQNYPEFDVVSEELNTENKPTQNCFVIDPIDGTVNFAMGLPLWGIQIACIKNFEVCASVIYLPKFNELYYADENGAFFNDKPIHVKDLGTKSGPYIVEGKDYMPSGVRMKRFSPHIRCFGCICLNYAWFSRGLLNGVAFKGESYWDFLPGEYIAKQAGAIILSDNNLHIACANSSLGQKFLEECKYNKDDIAFTSLDKIER